MTIATGTKLGPYEILAPLGAGGMGEVYRARDPRLNREVALKVLPQDFLEGEERKERFEREARLLAALNHPGIAAIYSFEEIPSSSSSSISVLVMELVDGETLRQRIDAGALPVRKAVELGVQIARGLAARSGLSVGLFAPRPFPPSVDGTGQFSLQTDHHPFGILWLQSTLPQRIARWGADALVSALTIGPARGQVPFVSTVHDLTPLTHPEWHAARTLVGFLPLWERTVERASRFLCVSRTTARELTERYPETASRVRVALNGVDTDFFFPADDPAARRRARQRYAADQPFILYLGTLEPRKNVEGLVAACERLWGRRRSRPDLVLAGGAGWKTASLHRRIARSSFRDKIHVAGYTQRDAARELYRAAEAFVYPSLAEGFGLPVLEAMACGTPVVASTAEALCEVGGDAALYAPPRDIEALARAIERALEDQPLRARLAAEGPRRAREFRWETAADVTAAAVEEAVREAH
jgi:glycosyltransferase involved in cell wall biosynthesis